MTSGSRLPNLIPVPLATAAHQPLDTNPTADPHICAGPYRLSRLLLAVLLALTCLLPLLSVPQSASALDVSSVTAKSNEDGGTHVLSNTPTRVTMESTVSDGEDLASMTVTFPTGSDLSQTQVKATVLEGLNRVNANESVDISGTNVNVSFSTPLKAGTLIRLEFYSTSLPAGTVSITGTYTDSTGQVSVIPATGQIEVTPTGTAVQINNWLDKQGWVQAWNSNTFLHLFFSPQLIVTSVPTLFVGWLQALALVAVGFPLAIPLGLLLAFMRMSHVTVLRGIGSLYVNVVRGTPLFLQMYIAFFGLPLLGIVMGNYILGVIVLAFNSGAYLAEIFRAGIQSIPRGQMEAARSLGMNAVQSMVFVIIPQAIRRVIPTMTSEFILLYKDTSLLAAVGVMETMMFAKTLTAATGNVTPYIVAAGFYLIVTLPLTRLAHNFEKSLAAAEGQGGGKKKRKHSHKGSQAADTPAIATVELTDAVHESM